jgi:hypothetical protein
MLPEFIYLTRESPDEADDADASADATATQGQAEAEAEVEAREAQALEAWTRQPIDGRDTI